jgi:hypothetical protein
MESATANLNFSIKCMTASISLLPSSYIPRNTLQWSRKEKILGGRYRLCGQRPRQGGGCGRGMCPLPRKARKKKCYQFCEVLRRLRVHALHINKPWSISFSIGGWPPGIALVVHMQYASAPLKTNRLHDSAKSASEIFCSYSTALGRWSCTGPSKTYYVSRGHH